MYLMAYHVPIFVDGPTQYISSDWRRTLEIQRDSLANFLPQTHVLGPRIEVGSIGHAVQTTLEVTSSLEGVQFTPSFPGLPSNRDFILRHRQRWIHDVAKLLPQASIIHAGIGNPFQPLGTIALAKALEAGVPSVFVMDMDKRPDLLRSSATQRGLPRLKSRLFAEAHHHDAKRGVRMASLSLLKGGALMSRYGHLASNARMIQDSSFAESSIVSPAVVEARDTTQGLRLVYCGRLIDRKGVDDSLRMLAAAIAKGAKATLDIIGDGPERSRLVALAQTLNISDNVCFHGAIPYRPELLTLLSEFHAILFSPKSVDTPRMIFDGYAAGLPLIGGDIEYVQERQRVEKATLAFPTGNVAAGAAAIGQLQRDQRTYQILAKNALLAAHENTAENWARRRAEWLREILDSGGADQGSRQR